MLAHLQWCISLLTMAEFQECLTSVFFIFFDKQAMAKKKKQEEENHRGGVRF